MDKRLVERIPFAKILAVLAATFVISLGLCGLTFAFGVGGNGNSGAIVGSLENLELDGMAFSAVGLILMAAVWGIVAAVSSFGQNGSKLRKLPDGESETKHSDER